MFFLAASQLNTQVTGSRQPHQPVAVRNQNIDFIRNNNKSCSHDDSRIQKYWAKYTNLTQAFRVKNPSGDYCWCDVRLGFHRSHLYFYVLPSCIRIAVADFGSVAFALLKPLFLCVGLFLFILRRVRINGSAFVLCVCVSAFVC